MNPDALLPELRDRYPSLAGLADAILASGLDPGSTLLEAPAGMLLFAEGMPCQGFPLVLGGAVSVARGSAHGRTLELYRVLPGEACVVSAACLLGQHVLTAHGTAVQATRLLLLSPTTFHRWTDHPPFRAFVFSVFAERLTDLMEVVDAVAFQRLDRRLAEYLLGHGRHVRATHQMIADELGTVREMVTRLLNRFADAGLVQLGRERIEIVDAERLRAVASGGTAPPV